MNRLTALRVAVVVAIAVVVGYFVGTTRPHHAAAVTPLAASSSDPQATSNGINVGAVGTASGVPDVVRLSMSVTTSRSTPMAALDDANRIAGAIQQKLRGDGVAAKDLQTTNLSLQPAYDYANGRTTLRGYSASESLTAVLRDMASAGHAIDDAAATGGAAARVDSITLDIGNTDALVTQARDKAFAAAKAKAKQYAALSGRHLGDVVSVSEDVNLPTQTSYGYKAISPDALASAGPSVPIARGSQDVTVTVQVVWSLD